MFSKVLIANRGEIACRIIRTCKRLGIATVAVFSDVDAGSLSVRTADEAVALGGAAAQETYLSIEKILSAAARTRADAIHPGYGFLSENDKFAEACTQAGLTFIGPPASAIRAMGAKSAAKALVAAAGLPVVPGYHGANQNPDYLAEQASVIGYPVLIKASAGGGGKGMRSVTSAHDFSAALAACKREAMSAFGDDHILLERYISQPRHVEVQVFADQHGHVLSLFERDCSVQRRHQKILEEAPAPGLPDSLRTALSHAARQAAATVNYVNAGTVEFLVDAAHNFYFIEMNTRLQVEHPVTEMITGLDLVEWQLRVAAGEPLPLSQEEVACNGHSVEARIYAEDAVHDFLPSTGKLIHYRMPLPSQHVRIETGVEQGDTVTAFYDPMVAKLITWDTTRELARQRLHQALGQVEIVGVSTNVQFLRRVVTSPSFTEPRLRTDLLAVEQAWITAIPSSQKIIPCLLAALSVVMPPPKAASSNSPWVLLDGWRINQTLTHSLTLISDGVTYTVAVRYLGSCFLFQLGGQSYDVRGTCSPDGYLAAHIDGVYVHAALVEDATTRHLFLAGEHSAWLVVDPLTTNLEDALDAGSLRSPLPGRVCAVLVEVGQRVLKGTPLLRIEAMKMEYTIEAPTEGHVRALHFSAGDQISEDSHLLDFERVMPAASVQ